MSEPEDDKYFDFKYRRYLKKSHIKRKKINVKKSDKFDLTRELEVFKSQQWTIKYKYKLLKAINSKYPLIQAHKQNRTQERFSRTPINFNPPSKSLKGEKVLDKIIQTDPEILEFLEQLKLYVLDMSLKVSKINYQILTLPHRKIRTNLPIPDMGDMDRYTIQ